MQDKHPGIENTPAVTKPRRSRFSFSDVASSRVDPEGETGIEQLPEITEWPENPPLQSERAAFRNTTEEVVPAFESPAFAEGETEGNHSAESAQETKAKKVGKQRQPSLSIPERRQHPRKQVLLFTYAVLGEDNGGLVFNLGEGGLALTAAEALEEHHFTKMRVRFPDSADWLETTGRLAWKNDSGKEAGIEFLDLAEDARVRIREWVSQGDTGGDASNEDGIRASQSGAQELPSFMDPGPSATELIETPASFEEQAFENQASEEHGFVEQRKTPAASSSALLKTGIKGVVERASVRRRVAKINPSGVPDHFVKPRISVARKGLSIAAGIALAVGSWMFFQRISLNEASGIVGQTLPNARSSHKPTQAPGIPKSEVGAGGMAADRPVHSKETVVTQNDIPKPSLQEIERATTPNGSTTAITNPTSGSPRAAKEKPHTEDALKYIGVESSSARRSEQKQHPAAPYQSEQKTKSPQLSASAPASLPENKPVENNPVQSKPTESKPVQIAQAFPAQNKDLNTTSPSPGASTSQPGAPPADLAKEKSPVAPKQPEPVLARTPVVTVSFDPFPSILMPKNEKSKKSHQGKNLRMGRLISSVDPVYPEEAKKEGIEGTVRVHAIFNREGAAQSVISVSGPPLLVPAAMNAVRQWRYSQTILGGQAMETEEDVTVLFRLANSADKN